MKSAATIRQVAFPIRSLLRSEARRVLEDLLAPTGIILTESRRQYDASDGPAIFVKNPGFYERVVRDANLGFGEAYMDGWCDVKRMDELYFRIFRHAARARLRGTLRERARRVAGRFLNLQAPWKARQDTNLHYDMSNDMFRLMLGDVMSYTCGYWTRPDMTLEEANLALFDRTCKKLELRPGMRLLDVGCGWGAFSKYAAENYGVSVVGVNISAPQLEVCRELCAGLPVEFLNVDCRNLDTDKYGGHFDAVAAIAMINHIGPKNTPQFFRVMNAVTKEGGLFLLHGIANRTPAYVNDAFMDKYIFRNAVCLSVGQLMQPAEYEFVLEDFQNFAAYYAKTCVAWNDNLRRNEHELRRFGFDERFLRMWEICLLGGAGLARAKEILLLQAVFSKGYRPGVYTATR